MTTQTDRAAGAAPDPGTAARGRGALLGLAALFFVPLVASFWLYYAGGWRPAGSTNHGELITPARPLAPTPFTLADGVTAARADLFRGKWSLVYIGDGACASADCRKSLWLMRQTRLLLAEDMSRVQRVLVAADGCCDTAFLQAEHKGLEVLRADPATMSAFVAQFPSTDLSHSVYVVDPLGNLMMRFDARQDPDGLLDDMKKLLKLSHIG
jgi:hypothetical protein